MPDLPNFVHSPYQTALVLGLVMAIVGIAWRVAGTMQARRGLRRSLGDDDPDVRISAIEVATAQSLGRYAPALLALARTESDGGVVDAIRAAVHRHLWEPSDTEALVQLRMWANQHETTQAWPAPDVEPGPASDLGPVRVVVTGAGGPAGVSVIRALVAAGHHVTALDADPLAAGSVLAQASAVIPRCDDPAFVHTLLDVVAELGGEAFISTVAEEMVVLSHHAEALMRVVPAWFPSPTTLELCMDKWRFAGLMLEAGIPSPATGLGTAQGVPGPWIAKPRSSRGSRDVYRVDRADDLDVILRSIDDPIVQTRLSGSEFTVDALVDRDGEMIGAVPRWRLETKAGISTKGRTFDDERVVECTAMVLSALRYEGPANVQGFVDPDGNVSVIEVNPRFSGGLPLSIAAGSDLVGEYLRGVLGLPMRPARLTFREGATMVRHFEEIIR